MRLYLRHIFESLKRSFLQPLLIVITLIIATSTLMISTKISSNMTYEYSRYRRTDNYVADITVKPSSKTKERILFEKDAKDIIGDAGDVIGELVLTGHIHANDRDEYIDISAVDLIKANEFYDIKYIEYRSFTEYNLKNSIIISDNAARRYDVGIGDTVTLGVMNEDLTFTIEAIAVDDGLLADSEWFCDISAVMDLITRENPLIGALSDTVKPYSALRIKVFDKEKTGEIKELLASSEKISDKIIILDAENVGGADFFDMVSKVVTYIAASIVIIISSIVIATSIELVRLKRRKETALFMISGATRGNIIKLNVLEYLIYSVVATTIALVISIPIFKQIVEIFGWWYGKNLLTPKTLAVGFLGAPSILISVYLITEWRSKKLSVSELLSNPQRASFERSAMIPIIFISALAILSVATVLSPMKFKVTLSIMTLTAIIGLIYFASPTLLSLLSSRLSKLIEKAKKAPVKLLLSVKELAHSHSMIHATRMITVLLSLMISVSFCLVAVDNQSELIETLLDFDYVAIGADEQSEKMIGSLTTTEDVFRMALLKETTNEANSAALGISVDDDGLEYINPDILPTRLPKNDEVVLSSGLAKLLDVEVGEYVNIGYETTQYSLKTIEIVEMTANILFVDATHFGLSNDLLCIKSDCEVDTDEFNSMLNLAEARGVEIKTRYALLSVITKTIKLYSKLLKYIVTISIMTSFIGVANTLITGYTESSNDRAIYYSLGMTQKEVRRTGTVKILTPIILAIILSIPISYGMLRVIDVAISSFGIDMLH